MEGVDRLYLQYWRSAGVRIHMAYRMKWMEILDGLKNETCTDNDEHRCVQNWMLIQIRDNGACREADRE